MRAIYGKQMRSGEGKRMNEVPTKWHTSGHCKTPDPATYPNAWCEIILWNEKGFMFKFKSTAEQSEPVQTQETGGRGDPRNLNPSPQTS